MNERDDLNVPGGLEDIIYMKVRFAKEGDVMVRYHRLIEPDPRELPHNHDLVMDVEVISGGYTQVCHVVERGRIVRTYEQTVNARDSYSMPTNVFHKIIAVKPDTRTRVCFTLSEPGEMLYVDPTTGEFTPNRVDYAALRRVNKSRRI